MTLDLDTKHLKTKHLKLKTKHQKGTKQQKRLKQQKPAKTQRLAPTLVDIDGRPQELRGGLQSPEWKSILRLGFCRACLRAVSCLSPYSHARNARGCGVHPFAACFL